MWGGATRKEWLRIRNLLNCARLVADFCCWNENSMRNIFAGKEVCVLVCYVCGACFFFRWDEEGRCEVTSNSFGSIHYVYTEVLMWRHSRYRAIGRREWLLAIIWLHIYPSVKIIPLFRFLKWRGLALFGAGDFAMVLANIVVMPLCMWTGIAA